MTDTTGPSYNAAGLVEHMRLLVKVAVLEHERAGLLGAVVKLGHGGQAGGMPQTIPHQLTADQAEQLAEANRAKLITLNDYRDHFWTPHRQRQVDAQKLSPKHVENDASLYGSRIKETLGALPLSHITLIRLEEWRDGLFARGLVHSSVVQVRRQLNQIFNHAIKTGHLHGKNPVADLKVEKRAIDRKQTWDFARADEVDQLLGADSISETQRCAIAISIYTGLRQGELISLHWGDVNLREPHNSTLTVRYGSVPSKVQPFFGAPKNKQIQTIKLVPHAYHWFKHMIDTLHGGVQPTADTTHGGETWDGEAPPPGGLVFANTRGKRKGLWWSDDYNFRWSAHGEDSIPMRIIGRDLKWHHLRHTTASHLVMGTWGVQWALMEVAKHMRHADTSTTQRYAHLADEHFEQQMAAMNEALQNGSAGGILPGDVVATDQSVGAETEPPRRVELLTYGLRNRCSTN